MLGGYCLGFGLTALRASGLRLNLQEAQKDAAPSAMTAASPMRLPPTRCRGSGHLSVSTGVDGVSKCVLRGGELRALTGLVRQLTKDC